MKEKFLHKKWSATDTPGGREKCHRITLARGAVLVTDYLTRTVNSRRIYLGSWLGDVGRCNRKSMVLGSLLGPAGDTESGE